MQRVSSVHPANSITNFVAGLDVLALSFKCWWSKDLSDTLDNSVHGLRGSIFRRQICGRQDVQQGRWKKKHETVKRILLFLNGMFNLFK